MNATDKQINYIYDLAKEAGATDGRRWLLDYISAPMSARPNKFLTRAKASEIIDGLTDGSIKIEEDADASTSPPSQQQEMNMATLAIDTDGSTRVFETFATVADARSRMTALVLKPETAEVWLFGGTAFNGHDASLEQYARDAYNFERDRK